MIDSKYKNYIWDICRQEDYMQVQNEINVLRSTYDNIKVIEVHNKDGQVIAIMTEVY